ncbi:MAG: sigma-54-dependent Fis family transcriptional regulator [Magnetococcales bacterium]|nr:sigma-54-dependent Fis family transcriptional regulator [Magnetococcales bacterium]
MADIKEILLVGREGREWAALTSQVRQAGFTPFSVPSVAAAKARLAERNPISLIIMAMEGAGDPLEGVRELTFLFRGMPILVAAVKGSVNEAQSAIAIGAADYLLLPIDDFTFQEILGRYANQYFDPELGRGRRIISADPNMKKLLNQVRRVAPSKATVLIQGESGTGKELIARYVHQVSDRHKDPFVAINCAALPENLLESELFGHVKGAFTGALTDRKGKFQQANGGTILLDEISEMSLNLQAKLLRVLQEGEVDPVGSRGTIKIDVRVIASTNRDLKAWSAQQKFREDLFYRLNVFPVIMPTLRERRTDIPLLAEHFRERFVAELGRNDVPFSRAAIDALQAYPWPGNVRELENIIQRALLVAEGKEITPNDLMIGPAAAEEGGKSTAGDVEGDERIRLPVGTTVREMEEILIRRTLNEVAGNRTRAAELLGISIRTLRNKLNEYAARLPE